MSVPRSDFMTQSLALSIDVCRGLGVSLLRIEHLAELFSGRCWLNIWPGIVFFRFCFFKLGTFFSRFDFVLIASGTEILWRLCLKFIIFFGNIAFPLASVSHAVVGRLCRICIVQIQFQEKCARSCGLCGSHPAT